MSELTTHPFAQCKEQVDFNMKIDNYMVTLHRFNPGPNTCNWHCTCLGFKFSLATNKGCKHTDDAKRIQCQFDQHASGEKPTKSGKCPHCKGPTITRNV